ncbi:VanZ family protein [Candidatus Omnitrophota bacterium]
MKTSSLRSFRWTIIILYLLFIYSTLAAVPAIWNRFNDLLGGRAVTLQYIIYAAAWTGFLLYIFLVRKERSIARITLLLLFTGIYFLIVKLAKYPAEKIHIAEYGLLGILLYNALRVDFLKFDKRLYLYAGIACLIAGTIDELIQWVLPNRYFAWTDIFINFLSSVMILLIIRFNVLKSEGRP